MRAAVLVSCSRVAKTSSTAASSRRASSRIGGRRPRRARLFLKRAPRHPATGAGVGEPGFRCRDPLGESFAALLIGGLPHGGAGQLPPAAVPLLDPPPAHAGHDLRGSPG